MVARLVLLLTHQRMNGRRSRTDGRIYRGVMVVVEVQRRVGRAGCWQAGGDETAFGIVFNADAEVVVVVAVLLATAVAGWRLDKVLQPVADFFFGGADGRDVVSRRR